MIESLSSIRALQPIKTTRAGFYRFSAHWETLRRQVEESRIAREETGKAQAEFAAADSRLSSRQEGGGTS